MAYVALGALEHFHQQIPEASDRRVFTDAGVTR